MKIHINKLHFPVTVLGYGRRIGLWFQGCSIGCAGCMSRDTWPRDERSAVDAGAVLAWCIGQAESGADGITFSGGEPFEQPYALLFLAEQLTAWRANAQRRFDLLCFSGMKLAKLQRDFGGVLLHLDAVIPEPFRQRLPMGNRWRGSSNQPLVPLSALGRERYSHDIEMPAQAEIQAGVSENRLMYIGVPRRGDLTSLEQTARERGVILEGVSWRG